MDSDQDIYNFLSSPEVNIVAVFLSFEAFIWTFLIWWGIWWLLEFLYDPSMKLLNIPA
jgi:hypothetical protein